MKQIAAREAVSLLKSMTRVLCAVGILALIFTTVNVTRFATSRDVPLPIAVLLDPVIGTALAGVLYVDARLASLGIRPPAWSTALRWSAGCTAALMNTWDSLWPDRQIGWPHQADPAAVLLHLTPALLLIALTETIAAYRRTVTDLLDRTSSADPTDRPSSPRPTGVPIGSNITDRQPVNTPPPSGSPDPHPASAYTHVGTRTGHGRPHTGDDMPRTHPLAPGPLLGHNGAADRDLWLRAVALDDTAHAATGQPVSIWRLRTDLRIGPNRARQIHDRLQARHTSPQHPAG
ncbi:extensin [Streptomyces sp. 35G-GA-8]|uniref:extensin n=1 Tax=Streptomyces sp. 35G-GA-8 TaxID=2939434 RepID=UPI00201EEC70|nr:extensin [Streptomyces sp. 35G-GA-8]MCL7377036.1 extensin [Streptomyces sp. 35G-GA-8]